MTAKTTTELKDEIKNLKAKILELKKIEKKSENSCVDFKRRIDDLTQNLQSAHEKNDSFLKQLSEKNTEFETARDTWMKSNEELSKDSNIVRIFNKEIGENNVELQKTIEELHKRLIESDECVELQKDRILELQPFEDDNYRLHNTRFFNSILVVFCIIELIAIFAISYFKNK